MIIQHILLGLVFAALGYGILRGAHWIVQNIAPIGWFERHVGSGSSYATYRALGALIIICSLLYMVGYLDDAIRLLFGWLFDLFGNGHK